MAEQWFLDLDGARSGPYNTPEVMSLVAEGEVLPHHRISTGLKGERWITVLDWRLEQAKISQRPPQSLSLEITSVKIEPETQTTPPELIARETKNEETLVVEQTPEAPAAPKPPESPLRSLTAEGRAEDSAEGNESAPPEPTQAPTANKTDAIADMFDLLQDSKQKREAKLLKSAQRESVSSASTSGNKSDSSSWIKFALSCVGVILLGLVLGQLFQQTTPLKKEVTKEVSKEGVTKSASNSDAQAQATPAIKTEVIDRSNEKMIIRSTVERRMEAAKPEVHPANAGSATPEKKANDREMEELKDLKKELQELKAMKDDLKNNPNNEAMDPNDPDVETLNANEEPLAPREFPRGENGLLTPAN